MITFSTCNSCFIAVLCHKSKRVLTDKARTLTTAPQKYDFSTDLACHFGHLNIYNTSTLLHFIINWKSVMINSKNRFVVVSYKYCNILHKLQLALTNFSSFLNNQTARMAKPNYYLHPVTGHSWVVCGPEVAHVPRV